MQKLKLQFNKLSNFRTFELSSQRAFELSSSQSGQVLFEILLAVAVLVGVVAVSVQLSQVSLQSAKTAGDRTQGTNLAREGFEAARAISAENWVSFYTIIKGNQYHPEVQTGKWVLVAGSESVVIGGEAYIRYLVADNVSRNPSTRDIESSYNSANDDPSTQKVTVTVEKANAPTISYSEYITRWKNASPVQQSWQGGSGQGTNPDSGDSANFNSQYDASTNIDKTSTPGSLKLEQQ